MPHHPKAKELAEPNVILRGVVGSNAHGLQVDDQDDRDEMGICVEPFEHFFGLRKRFEQWVHRTQPEGKRSGPGDLDLVVYSLAKWAHLALKGNPTILTLLYLPRNLVTFTTIAGEQLREMRDAFLSQRMLDSYLGYMRQQRGRMENKVKMPNRPELVARYGFDTKYAGHVIRLGHQGIELATKGYLTLPMEDPIRSHIIGVRTGKVAESDVLSEAAHLEHELLRLKEQNDLPPEGDWKAVEDFVLDCYLSLH